ncbi:MAG: septum formation inhibitor Maf [Opitutales bacterium]
MKDVIQQNLRILGVLACGVMGSACSADGKEVALEAPSQEQIQNFWFDGAEISRYALTQERYGEERPGYAVFVFVTEPFRTTTQVKADTPEPNTTSVLKLNAMREFNTGIYEYNTMSSVFSPIDTESFPHALKLTTTIQDWCGHAFSQFNWKDDGYAFELRSYFESEGDVNSRIAGSDVWLEDEIWTRIRIDPTELPVGNFKAIPGTLHQRFAHIMPEAALAEGSISEKGKVVTYTMTYPALGRTLSIDFDASFPYTIRAWIESNLRNGAKTTAKLEDRIERSYYWSLIKPGDEKLRKQLGLAEEPK